jgi:hypothetical protein
VVASVVLSACAAAATWWLIAVAQTTMARGPKIPGLLDLTRTVYLALLVTGLPNLIGLALLHRYLQSHPNHAARLRPGWWVLAGIGYGVVILIGGVITGLALLVAPALALVPQAPGLTALILPVLGMWTLYPAATVGGIVAVGTVIRGVAASAEQRRA